MPGLRKRHVDGTADLSLYLAHDSQKEPQLPSLAAPPPPLSVKPEMADTQSFRKGRKCWKRQEDREGSGEGHT